MARRGTQEYPVGDVATVRAPRGSTVTVITPGGTEMRIPATNGVVKVTLSEVGTWHYVADTSEGTFTVVQPPEPETPEVVGVVEPG